MRKKQFLVYVGFRKSEPHVIKYVGKTGDLINRIKSHVCTMRDGSKLSLYCAMRKYTDFTFAALVVCSSEEEAFEAEKNFIQLFNTYRSGKNSTGYNLTFGGEGTSGHIGSAEKREKLSKIHKGKLKTEEHKQKISEAHIGKTHTPETKKLLSEKFTGEKSNRFGTKHTEETLKKMSEAKLGEKHHAFGKPAKNAQIVLCVETGISYSSMEFAAKCTGTTTSNICSCINGRRKTTAGFHWVLADH